MMGRKPYLVLEIDSHTADAGLDTRIEAFLDIVDSFRRDAPPATAPRPARRYRVDNSRHAAGGRRHAKRGAVQPPRSAGHVRLAVDGRSRQPGARGGDAQAGRARRAPARADGPLDATRAQRGVGQGVHPGAAGARERAGVPRRAGAPRRPDEALRRRRAVDARARAGPASITSSTTGSSTNWASTTWRCSSRATTRRTGSSGPSFTRDLWRAILLSDYFTDVRTGIRLCARDVGAGLAVFERVWQDMLAALERGPAALAAALSGAREALAAIPRRRSLADVKKVLVVGEIYVRRDTFLRARAVGTPHRAGHLPEALRHQRVDPLHGLGARP